MPVWLVTGGSGFLGRHLLATLQASSEPGIEVVALGRRCPDDWPAQAFRVGDLDDFPALRQTIRAIGPAVVFHTAGRTPPADPASLYRGNTLATIHLLDALRDWGGPARVVLAGSAAELGPVELSGLPVGEAFPCRPVGSYGLSKWLATAAGLAARSPLDVMVARIFNPIGPGLPASQALGKFAALLADPSTTSLTVGDLDSRRDFLDVRDAARAMIALAARGRAGQVYHVGTGQSHRVGEGLDHLIRLSGRDVEVRNDPELARNPGPRDSRADIGRIVKETGWRPEVSWEQSLGDLWDEARARPRLPLTEDPAPL